VVPSHVELQCIEEIPVLVDELDVFCDVCDPLVKFIIQPLPFNKVSDSFQVIKCPLVRGRDGRKGRRHEYESSRSDDTLWSGKESQDGQTVQGGLPEENAVV
jgi:hypothetical protein